MSKITLSNLVNLQNETTAVGAINANNAVLTTALDNTVSRDGTSPNTMGSPLDMNSNKIINLPKADTGTQPVRKSEFDLISNGYTGNNTLLGTNNEITISSGAGTSTFSIPSAVTLTGKTITGGSFTGSSFASPIFTGVPVAPTPALGTNTTQLATTAFVQASIPNVSSVKLTGDGSDQTAALQALVNALPVTGGEIYIDGTVNITSCDLSGRRNIRILGMAQEGGGAGGRSRISVTAGAIGVGNYVFNCKATTGIMFSKLMIDSQVAAFNGTLIEYGGGSGSPIPTPSNYPSIEDCSIGTVGVNTVCVSLYGAILGYFNKVSFGGPGIHLKLQTVASVGFVNVHTFSSCHFLPSGSGPNYPITGSGEGLTFLGCTFEPGTDGVGRAWESSNAQQFKGVSFIGCWLGDMTAAGSEWMRPSWGTGLSITGCTISGVAGSYGIALGGVANADPQLGGCRGVSIQGNFFNGLTAGISCGGSIAVKNNVRGAIISGNTVTTGTLISSSVTAEQLVLLGNYIYGDTISVGAQISFIGLPQYNNNAAALAGGLQRGQLFQNVSTTEKYVQVVF